MNHEAGDNIYLQKKKIILNKVGPKQTLIIATLFAELLGSGDSLLLFGDIGSGKTFFSRGVIQRMMVNQNVRVEEVPSPTYTIVQAYDSLSPPVWHLDLYRLSNPDEIIQLGLEEVLDMGILLIEWPNKMGSYIPTRNISLTFESGKRNYTCRTISIEFNGSGWEHISSAMPKS